MVVTKDYVEYMDKMTTNPELSALDTAEKEKMIFRAGESIKMVYGDQIEITPRMAYMQAAYEFEGEAEGLAMLRRQGVTQAQTKDTSVTLEGTGIAPALADYMARVGVTPVSPPPFGELI